ncbi:hypothetical protein FGO68_gene14984 [Halteria grandinella]|uniref:Uncharacterized protein n=1 Tax=Halteria grandinella TaxID=5974 RepID=A0A8J8NTG8_HALGN|nr:hypothetical protein FGO68_gene14984 [Halteria grandinella]
MHLKQSFPLEVLLNLKALGFPFLSDWPKQMSHKSLRNEVVQSFLPSHQQLFPPFIIFVELVIVLQVHQARIVNTKDSCSPVLQSSPENLRLQ